MKKEDGNIENLGLTQLEQALNLCYRIFKGLFVALLLAFFFSGVHTIPPGKVGYIQRFGEWQDKVEEAGVHYAFPFLIDRVFVFDVSSTRSFEVTNFTPLSRVQGGSPSQRSLLTKDGNLIHTSWRMTYQLKDPLKAFSLLGEEMIDREAEILKAIFAGLCIREASKHKVENLLHKPSRLQSGVLDSMQKVFNDLETGFKIQRIDLFDPQVPEEVKGAFEEVQKQALLKEQLKNEALSEAEKMQQFIEARRGEKIAKALALAAQIRYGLKAEAFNVQKIARQFSDEARKSYLEYKLMSAVEKALMDNREQTFLLRKGSELRIDLGKDPVIDKLRRMRKKAATEKGADGE